MASGRKRITTEADRQRALEAKTRGLSNRAIAAEMGISHETVRLLIAEGPVAPSRPIAPLEPTDLPADLPEDATLADVEDMIQRCKAALVRASDDGNLTAHASLQTRLQGWYDRRRKFTPPTPPDPSEAPDVRAAAEEARKLLHRAVDKAIERANRPPG